MGKYRYKKSNPALAQVNASVFKKRELCNNQCPYFLKCPYAVYRDQSKKENKCTVVNLSRDEQKRFINMFVFEEDGLKNEALQTLWSLGKALNIQEDPREMKMYLESVVNVARAFKKTDKKVEKKPEPIEINMSTLNPKTLDHEIIPIPVKSDENDPQSLINSNKLDGILAKRDGKVRKRDENWGR